MQKCPGGLQPYPYELICWVRPYPRLPIINRLRTIIYPALKWWLKDQPAGWSLTGGCPGSQAELLAARSRAGLGSWAGEWAGEDGKGSG